MNIAYLLPLREYHTKQSFAASESLPSWRADPIFVRQLKLRRTSMYTYSGECKPLYDHVNNKFQGLHRYLID